MSLIAHFEDGGQFYLVQDFVDGHTLDDEMEPTLKWTESRVKGFLVEVLEILAYVHSQGSIHRDLKPNNMMRRRGNDKLVLIDFGAVREVRQTPSNMAIGLASGTITIGTPGYMPAEQTQGRPCYASDVYAVGCIAIEALIGESPYPNGFQTDVNTGEIRWRHLTQVSDEFAAIINKMVCYDHRQRYRNAGETLEALEPSIIKPVAVNPLPKTPLNQTPKTPVFSPPNLPANFTRRNFLAFVGLAGASALSIVAWERFKPKGNETLDNPKTPPTASPSGSTKPPTTQPTNTSTPEPTPTPVSRLQTQTLNNIITVDSSGRETNRRTVQVQYFVEDKISLPSGAKQIEMALIPAGKFDMGMPAQERQIALESALKYGVSRGDAEKWLDALTPVKNINFARSFYVSRYAVTQAQWFAVMGSSYDYRRFEKRFSELDNKFKGDNRPMVVISWLDAKTYCSELSKQTGRSYRLLTEAEWEYSCRAKTTTPFYFGETITPDLVNYKGDYPYASAAKGVYRQVITDVGNFPPNEWGLYDMHGNVWEWCEDVEHENYNGIPQDGSAWLSGGDQARRLLRGGSWDVNAGNCHSAVRTMADTGDGYSSFGFRVAASILL